MNTPRARQAGVVLLLVLAILGLLSVLAVSFVSMARLERSISRNYLAQTRAWMAAESGIEYAVARLQEYNGALSDEEMDDMSFVAGAKPGLTLADKASFQMAGETKRPISGRVESGDDDTYYILRVEDGSGRLNLNDSNGAWNLDDDPQPDDPEDDDDLLLAPGRLHKTVEALGNVLFEEPTGTLVANALFDTSPLITRSRPNLAGGVFSTMEQVRDALVIGYPSSGLPPALSQDQFDEFKNHVTLWSWQDPDVIRPSFQFEVSLPDFIPLHPPMRYSAPYATQAFPVTGTGDLHIPSGGPGDPQVISYKDFSGAPTVIPFPPAVTIGHVWQPQNAAADVYLFSDWQTKSFELEPRSPINVNAAPAALLEALVAPLRGWYLREGPGEIMSSDVCVTVRDLRALNTSLDYDPYMGTLTSRWLYSSPVLQYYWADETSKEIGGKSHVASPGKLPSGFRKDARHGEAHLTPALTDIVDVDLDGDGAQGEFPAEFAAALHKRIHDEGNPVETWQEMRFVLREILANIPDDHASWDDLWWSKWIPGMQGYDGRIERIMATWHGSWPPVALGAPVPDRAHWAQFCRDVLADCLLANFNPNSDLNDYNPDRHVYRHVDKAQLTQYTTELSLEPTGVFQIDSAGVVAAESTGDILARRDFQTVIRVFDTFRVTRQDQFTAGLGASASWDEYSSTNPYDDTAWNATVMTYPEPLLHNAAKPSAPLATYVSESIFDGSVALATQKVNPINGDFYLPFEGSLSATNARGNPEPLESAVSDRWTLGAQITYDLNAQIYTGTVGSQFSEFPKAVPTDHAKVAPLTFDAGAMPGNLLADGALSDPGRCLMYDASNIGKSSADGRVGGIEFWIKPNFDTRSANRVRRFFSMIGARYGGMSGSHAQQFCLTFLPHGHFTGVPENIAGFPRYETGAMDIRNFRLNADTGGYNESPGWAAPASLFFHWRQNYYGTGSHFGYIGVNTPTLSDDLAGRDAANSKLTSHPSYHVNPHTWSHISLRWDQNQTVDSSTMTLTQLDSVIGLTVNGKNPASLPLRHHFGAGNSTLSPFSLYEDDFGPVAIRLGEATDHVDGNWAADATYDEVIAYPSDTDLPLRDVDRLYDELGRYYKPNQRDEIAVYKSPGFDVARLFQLRPSESLTLRSVSWTCWWPENNRRVDYNGSSTGVEEHDDLLPWNVDLDPTGYDEAVGGDRRDDPLVDLLGWYEAFDPMSIDVGRRTVLGAEQWLSGANAADSVYARHKFASTYAGGSRAVGANGARIKLQAGDSLVFRAYFNVDAKLGRSIFESPVLDDVTFTCMKSVPDVLYWNAVNES